MKKNIVILGTLLSLAQFCFAQNKNYGDPVTAYPLYPNWQERAVLVLTNACRIDPVGFRTAFLTCDTILKPQNYPATTPVYWNVDLNRSGRSHATDMATTCGMQHNSCNGTAWDARIKSYYTPGFPIGENIATGYATPLAVMQGWLMDGDTAAGDKSGNDGHRANIMNIGYKELGVGYAYGSLRWYYFWVQDFGGGTSQYAYHPVAGGSHHFPNSSTIQFMAAYYDRQNLAPLEAAIYIEGTKHTLPLFLGTAARGAYALTQTKAATCRKYYFSFKAANSTVWRYPEKGVLVTCGEGSCQTVYLPPESLSVHDPVYTGNFNHDRFFTVSASKTLLQLRLPEPGCSPNSVQLAAINGAIIETWAPDDHGSRLALPIKSAIAAGIYLVRTAFPDGNSIISRVIILDE